MYDLGFRVCIVGSQGATTCVSSARVSGLGFAMGGVKERGLACFEVAHFVAHAVSKASSAELVKLVKLYWLLPVFRSPIL